MSVPELMTHSKLGASSAYRWMVCPGSVRLSEGMPDQCSTYANEGTAAHYLAEQCLLKSRRAGYMIGEKINITNDDGCLERFEVDEEMVEAVQEYLDAVNKELGSGEGKDLLVEQKFHLDWLHPGLFGTNDACVLELFGKLTVFDLKYGQGVVVDVEDNPQLKYYALGAAHGQDIEEVELVVVQPRAYHKDGPVRRWTLTLEELEKWGHEVLKPAAQLTETPDAPLKAGDHCRFCKAMGVCPEIKRHAMEVVQEDFTDLTIELPSPEKLEEEQLVKVLNSSGILSNWLKSVTAYAQHRLETGGRVPGYKLVARRSQRRWKDPSAAAASLLSTFGKDVYEVKTKSPAQMEKLLKSRKKELAEDRYHHVDGLLKKAWEKPDAGAVIAPETDRRPAIEPVSEFDVIEDDGLDFLN